MSESELGVETEQQQHENERQEKKQNDNEQKQRVETFEEEKVCRICHVESYDEPLISPCKCTGSIETVHESCLLLWLTNKGRSKCELCGYQFEFEAKFRDGAPVVPSFMDSIVVMFQTCVAQIPRLLQVILAIIIWLFVVPLLTYYSYTILYSIALKLKLPSTGSSATLTLFKYIGTPSSLLSTPALISLWFESHSGILLGSLVLIAVMCLITLRSEINAVLQTQQDELKRAQQNLDVDQTNAHAPLNENFEHAAVADIEDIVDQNIADQLPVDEPLLFHIPVNHAPAQLPAPAPPLDPLVGLLARLPVDRVGVGLELDDEQIPLANLDNAQPLNHVLGFDGPIRSLFVSSFIAVFLCVASMALSFVLTVGVGRVTIVALQWPLLLWNWISANPDEIVATVAPIHLGETIMYVMSNPFVQCAHEYYLDVAVLGAMGLIGSVIMVMTLSRMKSLDSSLLYFCAYYFLLCKAALLLTFKLIFYFIVIGFTVVSVGLALISKKPQISLIKILLEVLISQPLATLPALWLAGAALAVIVTKAMSFLQSIFRHEVLASSLGIFLRYLQQKDPHAFQLIRQVVSVPVLLQIRNIFLNYLFFFVSIFFFIGFPIRIIYRFTDVLPMQLKSGTPASSTHSLDFLLIQFAVPVLLERFNMSGMVGELTRVLLKFIVRKWGMADYLLIPVVENDSMEPDHSPALSFHSIRHFYIRVAGVFVSVWLVSVLVMIVFILAPLMLGRMLLSQMSVSLTCHDLYCWFLGLNIGCGFAVGVFKFVQFMKHYDMKIMLAATKRWCVIVGKITIALVPVGFVFPILIGTAMDLIIMNPFLLFPKSYAHALNSFHHPFSAISIHWTWSTGVVFQKLAIQLIRLGAHDKMSRALNRLNRDGWTNLNLRHLFSELIWPVVKELFVLIGLPACLYAAMVHRDLYLGREYDVIMWRMMQSYFTTLGMHRVAHPARDVTGPGLNSSLHSFLTHQLNVTAPLLGPITYEEHRSHIIPTMLPGEAIDFCFFRYIFVTVFVLRMSFKLASRVIEWLSWCQRTSFEQRYAVGRRIANPHKPHRDQTSSLHDTALQSPAVH